MSTQQAVKLDGPEVSRLTAWKASFLFFEYLPGAALSNLCRAEVEHDDADEGWGRGRLPDQPSAAAVAVWRRASSWSNAAICRSAALDQTVASYSHLCIHWNSFHVLQIILHKASSIFSKPVMSYIYIIIHGYSLCYMIIIPDVVSRTFTSALSWYHQGSNLDFIYF